MKAVLEIAQALENVALKIDRLTRRIYRQKEQLTAAQYAEWIAQFLREEADRLRENERRTKP